jgi:hypothetical protein
MAAGEHAGGGLERGGGLMAQGGPLYEKLAEIEHQRWSDWQLYFHSKCQRNEDGSLTVPAGYVAALERLANTPYAELEEAQQDNDRREVDRYWPLISGWGKPTAGGGE